MTAIEQSAAAFDAAANGDHTARRPDPEVPERAHRRRFTAAYKLQVLAAYDSAPSGEKGAILRREGLYSSHLVDWRNARDTGVLATRVAGASKPSSPDTRDATIAKLTKEKARLQAELTKTRLVVDVQAKLSALLEQLSESAATETTSMR